MHQLFPDRIHVIAIAVFSCILSFLASEATADELVCWESILLGSIDLGSGHLVSERHGDLLLVARYDRFLIYSLTNPDAPVLLSEVDWPEPIYDIEAEGSLAYLSCTERGVVILDISEPSMPKQVGEFNNKFMNRNPEITVEGGKLYHRSYNYMSDTGVLIIADVSSPEQPSFLSLNFYPYYLLDLSAQGSLLYITTSDDLLLTVDASDPRELSTTSSRAVPGYPRDLLVHNDTAYIAANSQLVLYDLANPKEPTHLSTTLVPGGCSAISTADDMVYTSNYKSLNAIEASDHSNPTLLGKFELRHSSRLISVHRNRAIFRSSGTGISIMDARHPSTSTPTSPTPIDLGVNVRTIVRQGTTAYIAATDDGILVADIAELGDINILSSIPTAEPTHDLRIVGDLLYSRSGSTKIGVYDIQASIAPTQLADMDFAEYTNDIDDFDFQSDLLAISDNVSGCLLFNIADTAAPSPIAPSPLLSEARISKFHGTLLITAGRGGQLKIFDIVDPSNPMLVGQYDVEYSINSFDIEGDTVFIGHGTECLTEMIAVDIADPNNPTYLSTYDADECYSITVTVEDSVAYLTPDSARFGFMLDVVDVSDPANPQLMTWVSRQSPYSSRVLPTPNALLLPVYSAGIEVIQRPDCSRCTADVNENSTIDATDVSAFIESFNERIPSSDLNLDGEYNFHDISSFITAYLAGCP